MKIAKLASAVLLLATNAAAAPRDAARPIGVLYSGVPNDDKPVATPPPEPCTEDCYLLSSLVLRGSVSGAMTFELKGGVRASEQLKIPLFGPPGQVRVDDVTIDGAPASIGFDGDRFHVFTSSRAFTIRGRVTLGSDALLSVPGPVVAVDAHLSSGRLIEGERLSGVSGAVLHFDPMTDGEETKPKAAPVFRLSRALRYGRETSFVYRLVASQATDLGTIALPLRYSEKIGDVQGATAWSADGGELRISVSGHEADLTISGTLPGKPGVASFSPDPRSVYEWWLVEADPEHRVETGGEPKLVETSQSPIPATFPGARVFLVQKGQTLDVDARSLVRGDVLAAVARSHQRFVAITGRGELISDESIRYDNNGLDHLMLNPAGKAMYVSTDQEAQRILHTEAGAHEVLVPARAGTHTLRVQSLSDIAVWPLLGSLRIPATTYPIATSTAETTIGLPEHVHPIAVIGGDRVRWTFARADFIAMAIGIALACFGFRRGFKTRVIASVSTAGLWFVSREAFVVATAGLFLAGAIFLASRFWRGTRLFVASGMLTAGALLAARLTLASDATAEPAREMFVDHPELPRPEAAGGSKPTFSGDPKTDITPVSLSFPTSERYVQASRQLVSSERPFVPRIFYVTSTLLGALEIGWLAMVVLLAWAHRDVVAALKARIVERLRRRPAALDPVVPSEAPPF